MMRNITPFFLLIGSTFAALIDRPQPRILLVQVVDSSQGYSTGVTIQFLVELWKEHLKERLQNVPSWSFNATFEYLDISFNMTQSRKLLSNRIKDSTAVPVSVVVSFLDNSNGKPISAICSANGIPHIIITSAPSIYPRPSDFKTTFFVGSAYVYSYIEMINAFADKGVQTVISVAMATDYDVENCAFAARYAATRGITLLKEINLSSTDTTADFTNIVRSLRDSYNPDAVLWCDIFSSLAPPEYTGKLHPISIFKNENYLPKALAFYSALDSPAMTGLKMEGLFQYVLGSATVSDKVLGSDYTEGNHDYSSMFRPSGTIASIYDQLNFGSTSKSLSSTNLFYKWYLDKRKSTPDSFAYQVWALFDVLEAALYRASKIAANLADGKISAEEVLNSLKYMDITTPNGPVQFDDNGDNIASKSLLLQALSTSDTADIVYPASARTAELVYPMPTWDERVYTWKLLKDNNVRTAIAVATVCSALILAICITVIVKRREPEIRMLSYLHLVIMCLCGLTVIWSLVLLWQYDTRPRQCQSFMWAVYLPASFIVHLVNIKAYRLSLFLIATATGSRPKPFSHLKVLRLTLMLLMVSVIVLGIIQAVDPPKRNIVVYDKYRPSLNEYRCEIGNTGKILLYLYVVGHLVFSGFCIVAVRNGMEDFRDGMIIKESFLILYLCLAVAFIMGRLNLSSSTNYLLRSVILTFGITLFLFRFLASRVLSYWIPEVVRDKLSHFHELYLKPIISSVNISDLSHVSKSQMVSNMVLDDEDKVVDFDAPVYAKDIPKENSLIEMINVLKDPNRKKIFEDVSKQALTLENVNFLCKVMEYEENCAKMLSIATVQASDEMKESALSIFNLFVKANSIDEVNVSASCRNQLDKKLMDWPKQSPIVATESARKLVESDVLKRSKVFQNAFHEISVMTYQNLWNKFRVAETNYLAMSQDDTPVTDIL